MENFFNIEKNMQQSLLKQFHEQKTYLKWYLLTMMATFMLLLLLFLCDCRQKTDAFQKPSSFFYRQKFPFNVLIPARASNTTTNQ